MRLCSIASGSSGNCIYVGSDTTHLLVDIGISGKRAEQGLNELGLKSSEIQGILITHEHADHISGLGVLARKLDVPIYATRGTICEMKNCSSLGKVDEALFTPIEEDSPFILGDMKVKAIRTSHDAAQPVAYQFQCEGKKAGIITDLGTYNDYIVENLQGMDVLLIEANHDIRMLQVGPYPYYLKQRILGDRGHLSNEASGRLLGQLLHDNMKQVILGHLSKENNMAELAYETVKLEIEGADNKYHGNDFPIQVAKRSEVSVAAEF